MFLCKFLQLSLLCCHKSTENKYTVIGSWTNVIAFVTICLSYCSKAEQTQMMQQNMHFTLSRFYCIHAVIKQSHIFCDEICFCKSVLYGKVTPEHTMKAYGAVEIWLHSLKSWQETEKRKILSSSGIWEINCHLWDNVSYIVDTVQHLNVNEGQT
jgi:hypothetical protein